jgi:hypothetical protein
LKDVDLHDPHVRRRLLSEGPVGEWETLPGTHTALMYDLIRFDPDGTGETFSDSVLGGETVERFAWSIIRPGLLACVVIDTSPETASEPDDTERIGFQFAQQHTDVGTFWVMRDPDWDGFWNFTLPLVPRPR